VAYLPFFLHLDRLNNRSSFTALSNLDWDDLRFMVITSFHALVASIVTASSPGVKRGVSISAVGV